MHGSLMHRSRELLALWLCQIKLKGKVESGVSAHHRRAEIRFSLMNGFPLTLIFTAKITSHIICHGIIHQKCSTLISASKLCVENKIAFFILFQPLENHHH